MQKDKKTYIYFLLSFSALLDYLAPYTNTVPAQPSHGHMLPLPCQFQ
jgi:hypothetical protein